MTATQPAPSDGWAPAVAAAALFAAAYPFAVALAVRRRLGVGWRYVAQGAAVFLLFQVLTRIPAVQLLQSSVLPALPQTSAVRWGWLAALALSAGLFEEVGRYAGYRVFMAREEKSWAKAVAFGVGHGGLEALLLAGVVPAVTLVSVRALTAGGVATLPSEQQALAAQQLAELAAQPAWLPLLSVWERFWTLPIHVALSVIVLQVFARGRLGWLWLAVTAHAAVNFVAVGAVQVLGPGTTGLLVGEATVALCGLAALASAARLRARAAAPAPIGSTTPGPHRTGHGA